MVNFGHGSMRMGRSKRHRSMGRSSQALTRSAAMLATAALLACATAFSPKTTHTLRSARRAGPTDDEPSLGVKGAWFAAELFGKAIRRIHNDDSISALFI